jgi:hypothetical protein
MVLGLASPAFAYANHNFLGQLSASAPTPNYVTGNGTLDISAGTVTITTKVTNLTTSPVTANVCLTTNQVLSLIPKGATTPVDISSGNPTVTFYNGWVANSTQGATTPGSCNTFQVPASATDYPISLSFPLTTCGYFQYDVRNNNPNKPTILSAGVVRVLGCGSGSGQRFTPGYWKNHKGATSALLPVKLGNYTVSSFADAQAVFAAMKCSNAADCLAGHLLAAELDVANGSASCISGTVSQANQLLASLGYAGPGSVKPTGSQASQALTLESQLDAYTNDSTGNTC